MDLDKKECGCRMWQLNGIGCVHSVATLGYLNREYEVPYVSGMYLAAIYRNAYKYPINGMNGSALWPATNYIPPLPPLKRRMPGRPTIKRRRDASERSGAHSIQRSGRKNTCSICKQHGHNKSTCPTVAPGPKKVNVKRRGGVRQTQESVNNGQMHGSEELMDVDVNMAGQEYMDEVFAKIPNDAPIEDPISTTDEPLQLHEVPIVGREDPIPTPVEPPQALEVPIARPARRRLQHGEGPSRKRSERILLKKLGKQIEGEGSSLAEPMDL